MSPATAIRIIASSGNLSAEALNTLHACIDGHPWNNAMQWRNAEIMLAGRGPWLGDEWHAIRVILEQAEMERNATAA